MTEIRLAARPGNRILAGTGLALIGLMLALWAALTLAVVAAPWGFSWWRALGLAALLLCTGGTGIVFRQLWRETFMRRPRLVVESGRLVVHHPVYLKKPYPIDREDVVAASVRKGDESWWGDEARLVVNTLLEEGLIQRADFDDELDDPWDEVEEEDDAALLDGRVLRFVPAVTHDPKERPNVALHLRRPIGLDDYRRVGLNRTVRGKPWPETSPKRGLLLAVEDLDALRGVLSAWGLEEKFGLRQAELVRPSPIDVKLARREMIGGLLFLAYFVAVVVSWLVELFTD